MVVCVSPRLELSCVYGVYDTLVSGLVTHSLLDSNFIVHITLKFSISELLLYLRSERSKTGGYTVFTFVCVSVCVCVRL